MMFTDKSALREKKLKATRYSAIYDSLSHLPAKDRKFKSIVVDWFFGTPEDCNLYLSCPPVTKPSFDLNSMTNSPWDGYRGEDTVLIRCLSAVYSVQFFYELCTQWLTPASFIVRPLDGLPMKIRPKRFIIFTIDSPYQILTGSSFACHDLMRADLSITRLSDIIPQRLLEDTSVVENKA